MCAVRLESVIRRAELLPLMSVWLLLVQAALNVINAVYFADRVVANCALAAERLQPTPAREHKQSQD